MIYTPTLTKAEETSGLSRMCSSFLECSPCCFLWLLVSFICFYVWFSFWVRVLLFNSWLVKLCSSGWLQTPDPAWVSQVLGQQCTLVPSLSLPHETQLALVLLCAMDFLELDCNQALSCNKTRSSWTWKLKLISHFYLRVLRPLNLKWSHLNYCWRDTEHRAVFYRRFSGDSCLVNDFGLIFEVFKSFCS